MSVKADFEPSLKRASHFVKIIVACPHRLPKLPESTLRKQARPNNGSLFCSHCGKKTESALLLFTQHIIQVIFLLNMQQLPLLTAKKAGNLNLYKFRIRPQLNYWQIHSPIDKWSKLYMNIHVLAFLCQKFQSVIISVGQYRYVNTYL
jgi:hypothetical protein